MRFKLEKPKMDMSKFEEGMIGEIIIRNLLKAHKIHHFQADLLVKSKQYGWLLLKKRLINYTKNKKATAPSAIDRSPATIRSRYIMPYMGGKSSSPGGWINQRTLSYYAKNVMNSTAI